MPDRFKGILKDQREQGENKSYRRDNREQEDHIGSVL